MYEILIIVVVVRCFVCNYYQKKNGMYILQKEIPDGNKFPIEIFRVA